MDGINGFLFLPWDLRRIPGIYKVEDGVVSMLEKSDEIEFKR